jgi:hypothetical protein
MCDSGDCILTNSHSYTPEGNNPRDKDVYATEVALDAFRLIDIPQRSPQVGVLVLMPHCQLGRFGHGCM